MGRPSDRRARGRNLDRACIIPLGGPTAALHYYYYCRLLLPETTRWGARRGGQDQQNTYIVCGFARAVKLRSASAGMKTFVSRTGNTRPHCLWRSFTRERCCREIGRPRGRGRARAANGGQRRVAAPGMRPHLRPAATAATSYLRQSRDESRIWPARKKKRNKNTDKI